MYVGSHIVVDTSTKQTTNAMTASTVADNVITNNSNITNHKNNDENTQNDANCKNKSDNKAEIVEVKDSVSATRIL